MSEPEVIHATGADENGRSATLSVERMLLSSLPPEETNCDALFLAGFPCGRARKTALSGSTGSSPSASVPRSSTSQTVARCLDSSGHSSDVATSRTRAERRPLAEAVQCEPLPFSSSCTTSSAMASAACSASWSRPSVWRSRTCLNGLNLWPRYGCCVSRSRTRYPRRASSSPVSSMSSFLTSETTSVAGSEPVDEPARGRVCRAVPRHGAPYHLAPGLHVRVPEHSAVLGARV